MTARDELIGLLCEPHFHAAAINKSRTAVAARPEISHHSLWPNGDWGDSSDCEDDSADRPAMPKAYHKRARPKRDDCQEISNTGMAERGKPILGARAPSPAMSAAALNSYSVKKFEIECAAHAAAGEGARAPSTNQLVLEWIDFLGKATVLQQAESRIMNFRQATSAALAIVKPVHR